jgi:hypothetical protein
MVTSAQSDLENVLKGGYDVPRRHLAIKSMKATLVILQ